MIIYRLRGIGPDYARLHGDSFGDLFACAFTSKSSENPPNIYISLKTIAWDAPQYDETFEQHLVRIIDHEMFHLFSPTLAPPWDADETGAIAFEDAGVLSREA